MCKCAVEEQNEPPKFVNIEYAIQEYLIFNYSVLYKVNCQKQPFWGPNRKLDTILYSHQISYGETIYI